MIQIFIRESWDSDAIQIYAATKSENDGKRYALEISGYTDGVLEIQKTELKEAEYREIKPLLSFNHHYGKEWLQAIRKALDDYGVPKDSESRLEGKLEATTQHLQDMRRLVFKRKAK